jgi:hypothetical protein
MTLPRLLLCAALLFPPPPALSVDVVGWYVGTNFTNYPPEALAWDVYTHIVLPSGPTVDGSGAASCTLDAFHTRFLSLSRQHNRSLTWGGGVASVYQMISNASWASYTQTFLATIGGAARDCGVTGIEFDYECPPTPLGKAGIVSAAEANNYTVFLTRVLAALDSGSTVSADIGVWGLDGAWGGGSYPLELEPWVNVTLLSQTAGLFVNSMSYHDPLLCDIGEWALDVWFLADVWKIPRAQINLGIGFFFFGPDGSEPIWNTLSGLCPGVAASDCVCAGVPFVGMDLNAKIGALVREQGLRGVFPWAANYDVLASSPQSLIRYVGKGLRGP